MPSGRDSFRRNRVAPSVPFYFSTSARHMDARKLARSYSTVKFTERQGVATCMFNVRGAAAAVQPSEYRSEINRN